MDLWFIEGFYLEEFATPLANHKEFSKTVSELREADSNSCIFIYKEQILVLEIQIELKSKQEVSTRSSKEGKISIHLRTILK